MNYLLFNEIFDKYSRKDEATSGVQLKAILDKLIFQLDKTGR